MNSKTMTVQSLTRSQTTSSAGLWRLTTWMTLLETNGIC